MEIIPIFGDDLYSFKHPANSLTEFDAYFASLRNTEFLFNFFKKNQEDLLRGTGKNISIEQAVLTVRKETIEMLSELEAEAKTNNLASLFRHYVPNSQGEQTSREKYRFGKGWLRLYAIRLEDDIFIITGGAIKLNHLMKDREHTKVELTKLGRYRDWCINEGIIDIKALTEYLKDN